MDEKMKDKKSESKVSMIGPLAALLAAIIAAFTKLPPMLQYIMVLLFTVIALVSVYVVFGQQFAKVIEKIRTSIRHKFLAKKHYNEFHMFIDRFDELLNDSYTENMVYAFIHLESKVPTLNYPRSLIYNLSNQINIFKEEMEKTNKRDFFLLIKWFESILRIYNSQLVIDPYRKIRNLNKEILNNNEINDYEKSRENYNRFLQDYMLFAKTINKAIGEKSIQEYFEKPGQLYNKQ